MVAHIILFVITVIVGVGVALKYENPTYFLLMVGVIYFLATIIFLIFAIPLERGRLKQKSILWRMLTWNLYDSERDNLANSMSVCFLPGLIARSFLWALAYGLYLLACVVAITFGNIIGPLFMGRFYILKKRKKDIPKIKIIDKFPDIYLFDFFQFRPWMLWLLGAAISLVIWGGYWLFCWAIEFVHTKSMPVFFGTFILASLLLAGIRFCIKKEIFISIWNLLVDFEKKICRIKKIPEE